jgi:hypothetical protein
MPNRFAQVSAADARTAEDTRGSLRATLVPFVVGCVVVLACLALYAGLGR